MINIERSAALPDCICSNRGCKRVSRQEHLKRRRQRQRRQERCGVDRPARGFKHAPHNVTLVKLLKLELGRAASLRSVWAGARSSQGNAGRRFWDPCVVETCNQLSDVGDGTALKPTPLPNRSCRRCLLSRRIHTCLHCQSSYAGRFNLSEDGVHVQRETSRYVQSVPPAAAHACCAGLRKGRQAVWPAAVARSCAVLPSSAVRRLGSAP